MGKAAEEAKNVSESHIAARRVEWNIERIEVNYTAPAALEYRHVNTRYLHRLLYARTYKGLYL